MTEHEQQLVVRMVGSANQHNPTTMQLSVTFNDGKAILKQFGLEVTCFTFSDACSLITQWVMMTAIGVKA